MRQRIIAIAEKLDLKVKYSGPTFERPFAAVINSHQSRFPEFEHPWVQNTIKAIEEISGSAATVLSSAGLNSYELALWYAGRSGLNQIVVMPARSLDQTEAHKTKLIKEFRLEPERTGFLFFKSIADPKKSTQRDRLIMALADKVFPISVSKKGRTNKMLDEIDSEIIERRFEVAYKRRTQKINIPDMRVQQPEHPAWPFLTHWTRRSSEPFPGQTKAGYYEAILNTRGYYSHSAFGALVHILDKKIIHGTKSGIRGGHRVVSFTGLKPTEAIGLMKWNASRIRFTFEPYGIAVQKHCLETLGARRVIYGDKDDFNKLSESEQPFYQNWGKEKQWMAEQEWRIPGDIHLSDIPKDQLIIIVPDRRTGAGITSKFKDYTVITPTCFEL
jgi:hypothetical protein